MQEQKSPLSDSYIQGSESEQNFQYKIWLSKDSKHYDIYLTHRGSYLIIGSNEGHSKQDIWIKTHDFIGFTEQNIDEEWKKITLNVFAKKKKFMRKIRRYLSHFTVYVNISEYGNKKMDELICKLLTLSTNKQHKTKEPTKKLMIYFNPCSGSNSKKHLDRVIDFMGLTCCKFDILTTQRRNHCKEHIDQELNMKSYDAIVIISGDGLMHEFVNSKAVGVIPVTHVPAGSGNAFAKNQMTLAGEACEDEQAIFLAIKGKIRNFNLTEFQLQKIPTPIYSFLSFEWCFMADIDMNSQFLRCLGGLRFQIYGLWRLLAIRKYKGKFTYSLNSTNLPPLNSQITDIQNFKTEEKVYLHQLITFVSWISDNYQISPLLQIQDQCMELQAISQDVGRIQLTKYMLNCETGNHFDRQKKTVKQGYQFDWKKIKSFRLQPNGDDIGVFGIDGEKYEAQKVQAKTSEKKVLTFT